MRLAGWGRRDARGTESIERRLQRWPAPIGGPAQRILGAAGEERATGFEGLCCIRHWGQRGEHGSLRSAVQACCILLGSCAAWLVVFWVPVVAHAFHPLGKAHRVLHECSEP